MDLFDKMEEELEYLRWFHNNVDFGPAHEDVMCILHNNFEEDTGKKVPEYYDYRISFED